MERPATGELGHNLIAGPPKHELTGGHGPTGGWATTRTREAWPQPDPSTELLRGGATSDAAPDRPQPSYGSGGLGRGMDASTSDAAGAGELGPVMAWAARIWTDEGRSNRERMTGGHPPNSCLMEYKHDGIPFISASELMKKETTERGWQVGAHLTVIPFISIPQTKHRARAPRPPNQTPRWNHPIPKNRMDSFHLSHSRTHSRTKHILSIYALCMPYLHKLIRDALNALRFIWHFTSY
jgi:hypothetical protein